MEQSNNNSKGCLHAVVPLYVIVPLVLIGLFLFAPMLMPPDHTRSRQTQCMNNMAQIGRAIYVYTDEWGGHYPTNRPFLAGGKLGPVSNSVKLSPAGVDKSTGRPYSFRHGVTWVESLRTCTPPRTDGGHNGSTWECPSVRESGYEPASGSAAVSYVMNRNVIEKSVKVVRYPSRLMLIREMDRLVDSELRPVNASITKGQPPVSAFLTGRDQRLGVTNCEIHSSGSSIVFADGHVKKCSREQLPERCKWDANTKTWGNADGSVMVSP